MNKLLLASLTALMAGAIAAPAFAADTGRSAAGEASRESAVSNKGPTREEAREELRGGDGEGRHGGVTGPGDRGGSGSEYRDPRADLRGDNRDDRGWQRDDDRDQGSGSGQWQAQHRDYDRDRGDYDRDRGDRHDDDRHGWDNDRRDWDSSHHRDSRYYTRYRDSRWSGYHWSSQYRYRAPSRYIYPSGYRPYQWQVGYRLPYNYYNSSYYYVDYRAYRLPPPPYGYHWVRVDRDVVLVSLASGLIRDVLWGLFY